MQESVAKGKGRERKLAEEGVPSVGASEAGRRREWAHATKARARARMRGGDIGPLFCWPLLLLLRRPRDNSCPLRVEDVGRGWLWSEWEKEEDCFSAVFVVPRLLQW